MVPLVARSVGGFLALPQDPQPEEDAPPAPDVVAAAPDPSDVVTQFLDPVLGARLQVFLAVLPMIGTVLATVQDPGVVTQSVEDFMRRLFSYSMKKL
ncbi:MAG: hypothetical protein LBD43_01390 [Holosporales bacterium]|jgi:hypothetical protein|nr:hypothetical protein [Holosporales bacterium]